MTENEGRDSEHTTFVNMKKEVCNDDQTGLYRNHLCAQCGKVLLQAGNPCGGFRSQGLL